MVAIATLSAAALIEARDKIRRLCEAKVDELESTNRAETSAETAWFERVNVQLRALGAHIDRLALETTPPALRRPLTSAPTVDASRGPAWAAGHQAGQRVHGDAKAFARELGVGITFVNDPGEMEWRTGSPGFQPNGAVVIGRHVQAECPNCVFVMTGTSSRDRAETAAHELAHHQWPDQDEAFAKAYAAGFMAAA